MIGLEIIMNQNMPKKQICDKGFFSIEDGSKMKHYADEMVIKYLKIKDIENKV